MSKSLMISNGDLVVTGRSLQTVSGQDKLIQDLTCLILERVGTDPATPDFGSTIDGGFVNGQQLPSYIGESFTPTAQLAITSDIQSLLRKYQTFQLQKVQGEAYQFGGKTTLDDSEIIYSIDSVTSKFVDSALIVQVFLTTLAKQTVKLTIPIQNA